MAERQVVGFRLAAGHAASTLVSMAQMVSATAITGLCATFFSGFVFMEAS